MKILNSKGQEILLNAREQRVAEVNQKLVNALGYEIPITTLTTIMKKVSEQKFFYIAPADYMPIRVGEGAWSSQLTTYLSYNLSDDFATGVINTGANNGRLASGDAGVDSVNAKVINWAKSIGWTLFDLEQAAKSGNWDIVTAKERARKQNWDLGIQQTAFLGLKGDPAVLGLLTQTAVTPNTTRITKAIKDMTPAELKTFTAGVLGDYRAQCNYTAWPTHFTIPESDFTGLAAQASADFPIKSVKQVLEESFQEITGNKQFKIQGCAYAESARSGLGVQRYALYNAEETSMRMDIPVDYTSTLANSIDNFSFQNVGYGQFTGFVLYRPLEMMYFQY